MSKNLRQLTQKGDPMLRVQLPKLVHEMLNSAAKDNKRKLQDEIIKRLAASFKNEAACNSLQDVLVTKLKSTT